MMTFMNKDQQRVKLLEQPQEPIAEYQLRELNVQCVLYHKARDAYKIKYFF